jgi:hypothetical protein
VLGWRIAPLHDFHGPKHQLLLRAHEGVLDAVVVGLCGYHVFRTTLCTAVSDEIDFTISIVEMYILHQLFVL